MNGSVFVRINPHSMTLLVSISGLFLTVALLISKIQYPSTHFLLALHAVLGVSESAAIIMLVIDLYPAQQIESTIKTLSIVSIGALTFINIFAGIVQLLSLVNDQKVKKWLKGKEEKGNCNLFWFSFTVILGILINYKIKLVIFSRLFGFNCFKCKLETIEKFKIFNVFAFLGLLPQIIMLYCSIKLILGQPAGNDRFLLLLDAIIVLAVNVFLTAAVVPKDESFFQEKLSGVTCGKVNKVAEESLISALASNFEDGTMSCLPEVTEVDESHFATTKRRKKPRAKKLMQEIKEESIEDNTEMTGSMFPEEADRQNTQSREFALRFTEESNNAQKKKEAAVQGNIYIDTELMKSEDEQEPSGIKEELYLNSKREELGLECPENSSQENQSPQIAPTQQKVQKITVVMEGQTVTSQPQPKLADVLIQDEKQYQQTRRTEAERLAKIEILQIDEQLQAPQRSLAAPKIPDPVVRPLELYEAPSVEESESEQPTVEQQIVFKSASEREHLEEPVFFAIVESNMPEVEPNASPLQDYAAQTPQAVLRQGPTVERLSQTQGVQIQTEMIKEAFPNLRGSRNNKKLVSPEQMAKHESGNIHLAFEASQFEVKADQQNKPIRKKGWENKLSKDSNPISQLHNNSISQSESEEERKHPVVLRRHLKTEEVSSKGRFQTSNKQSLIEILESRRRKTSQQNEGFKEFKRTGENSNPTLLGPKLKKHASTQESAQFLDQAPLKPTLSHSIQPLKPTVSIPKTTSPKRQSNSKEKALSSITKSHLVFQRSFKQKMKETTLEGRSMSVEHYRGGSPINKNGLSLEDRKKMSSLERIYLQRLLK